MVQGLGGRTQVREGKVVQRLGGRTHVRGGKVFQSLGKAQVRGGKVVHCFFGLGQWAQAVFSFDKIS